MAVGVGSFSDPAELQGLSHYLEHMLFMGSQAFPDENAYDAFLSSHGGSSNAYTEMACPGWQLQQEQILKATACWQGVSARLACVALRMVHLHWHLVPRAVCAAP